MKWDKKNTKKGYYMVLNREMKFDGLDNVIDVAFSSEKPQVFEVMGLLSEYEEGVWCHIVTGSYDELFGEIDLEEYVTTYGGFMTNVE